MKLCVYLLVIFLMLSVGSAQWDYKYSATGFKAQVNINNKVYFACLNGVYTYDFKSQTGSLSNMINSDLPGNYVNSLLTLDDGSILISTNRGLAVLENGVITTKKQICTDYPDNDSRDLHKDSLGNIWTFTATKIYFYKNKVWTSIDLSESIKVSFSIMKLTVANDVIWVQYEDNSQTTSTYYNYSGDDFIYLALVSDKGIVKQFDTKDKFPFRRGTQNLFYMEGNMVLKNYDATYIYNNDTWSKTNMFDVDSILTPNWYANFANDNHGNIWYVVSDKNGNTYSPASFDLKTSKVTQHLSDYVLPYLYLLDDTTIFAGSLFSFFIKNDTGWVRKSLNEDYGINYTYYYMPEKYDGKNYLYTTMSKGYIQLGTFFCIDDTNATFSIKSKFPFTSVSQFGINKKQQGFFKGINYGENFQFETEGGYVQPKLMTNVATIKSSRDGNVYFNHVRLADSTLANPFISTWDANGLVNIDMGYTSNYITQIFDFDISGSLIGAIGSYYYYKEDSLNSFLSVYNTSTGELKKYDKTNSCMPDYFLHREGMQYWQMDTAPKSVCFDANNSLWISTNYSLIHLSDNECRIFDLPDYDKDSKIWAGNMAYDKSSNELLVSNYPTTITKFYYYQINIGKWDSIDVKNSGFISGVNNFKKLANNNIWATDSLGYMYRYIGSGLFRQVNLEINGRPNLGFPINDFTLDANDYLHLGTDVGLLTNKHLFVSVENLKYTQNTNLNISPNPASDFIGINIPVGVQLAVPMQVEIYDIMGERIKTTPSTSLPPLQTEGEFKIDVSGFVPGVYFVKVGDRVSKFIKI